MPLAKGIFLNDLNIARVTSIFKDRDLGNYRPISILPFSLNTVTDFLNF